MVVIPCTDSGLFPSELLVEANGGQVGLGDLKKNSSPGPFTYGRKQGGSDAATPESGIHGQIENLGFVRPGLAPGTETGRRIFTQRDEQRETGIVAERPLRGFGTVVLNAGDGGVIALRGRADQEGAQFLEPGASERPASGCTTELPQIATPLRMSALRKLLSMA